MLRLLMTGLALGAGLWLAAAEGPTPEGERPDRPVDLGARALDAAFQPQRQAAAIDIRVPARERQTFQGLGASTKDSWAREYGRLPRERQEQLSDLQWSQTGLNSVRIWFQLEDYAPEPNVRDFEAVCSPDLVQVLRDAQARGVTQLCLAPCAVPDYLCEERQWQNGNGKTISSTMLREEQRALHAAIIADFIAELAERHDLHIDVTGVQNEPNTNHDCYFDGECMVDSVKLLRQALDQRGLQQVGIIAPETASADHVAHTLVEALKADPEAWSAVRGIGTHSYNMAADERLASIALNAGKEYWQTESSVPGKEVAGDIYRASTMATTLLSDLNHGVTHWIHFIGFAAYDPRDNGTRMIGFDPDETGEDWYTLYDKHRYLAQLAQAFQPGCVLRKAHSDREEHMHWTYGRKPRVVVAAGRNPDGSWAVGISNYTYNDFPTGSDFHRENAGHPAQVFTVAVTLDDLSDVPEMPFEVQRSDRHGTRNESSPLIARYGQLELAIDPLELVTLRSAADSSSP